MSHRFLLPVRLLLRALRHMICTESCAIKLSRALLRVADLALVWCGAAPSLTDMSPRMKGPHCSGLPGPDSNMQHGSPQLQSTKRDGSFSRDLNERHAYSRASGTLIQ
jgi:hypothetical protein